MSLETRAIIELVNQGHLPPLCLNQKTPKRKDITMQVTEKHSHAEHKRVIRERYMLCCDCGYAYKETKIFKKSISKRCDLLMPGMCYEIGTRN